jgi:hypothetical protein
MESIIDDNSFKPIEYAAFFISNFQRFIESVRNTNMNNIQSNYVDGDYVYDFHIKKSRIEGILIFKK